MYWGILFLLLIFLFLEIKNKKINRAYFFVSYLILTLLITLKQGQGTDYYNYEYIYQAVEKVPNLAGLSMVYHCEPGYLFLNYLAVKCGFSYILFSALFSFMIMAAYYPFFYKTCKCSILPLTVFYMTFFLIYPFSGARQGFVLGVLLSFLYPMLKQRKYITYIFITLLSATIHTAILISLLFPFIYKLHLSKSLMFFILAICIVLMVFKFNILNYIPISLNYEQTDYSYLAILLRVLVILPLFLIPDNTYKNNPELLWVRNILFFGFVIYTIFSYSDLVASRLNVICRVLEGLFMYLLVYHTKLKKINMQIVVYSLVLNIAVFYNNINGFISQGEYQHCSAFTYPYLSLFDSPQKIMYYRGDI